MRREVLESKISHTHTHTHKSCCTHRKQGVTWEGGGRGWSWHGDGHAHAAAATVLPAAAAAAAGVAAAAAAATGGESRGANRSDANTLRLSSRRRITPQDNV